MEDQRPHTEEEIRAVAMVCHEANRAYCKSIGDNSQPSWATAPLWQVNSAIAGVKFHLEHPNSKPEDSHKSWMKHKKAEGWVYGKMKDAELKTHPCMVRFDKLPIEQQKKDRLFLAIVRALQ